MPTGIGWWSYSTGTERGYVKRRTVGAGAVVWWLTASAPDRERDYLTSFGKYADTDLPETVERSHEELGRAFGERHDELFG